MNKVNERFFYSKDEDEQIVKFVKEDFLRRQRERKKIERTKEKNH